MILSDITLASIPGAAKQICSHAGQAKIWAFYGEMGAGKTTFIKAVCHELGVTGELSSPTFSLVNEYQTQDNQIVYHFDFYRIRSVAEAYDIGYEDYFFSGHICLVEWPEKIEELLDGENVLKIHIEKQEEFSRTITIE